MHSLTTEYFFTDIYGLKFCVQFLNIEIFTLLGFYVACVVS